MRAILLTFAALTAIIAAASINAAGRSNEIASTERAKIESLITAVEKLSDARFVRNGRAYGAATAAKFLRGKWKDRAAAVRTAEDFIDHIATRSSTTGRPYLIRFSDGREVPAAVFFRSELAKLQRGQ